MATISRRRPALALAAALALIGGLAGPALASSTSPSAPGSASGAPSGSASDAASASPAGSVPPTSAGTVRFTVGIANDVDSLNPFTGIVSEAYEAYQLMYDSLAAPAAKDFAPSAQLATATTASADGKTWTYTIRSGVLWSDGVPLTAKDVAYTFNRIIKGSYEQTNWGNYVANIATVTAPDDTTVVMTTKAPAPVMRLQIVPILPEHVWSKISAEDVKSFSNEQAVGSGPFVLAERRTGQYLRFTANKKYWAGAPKIDELVFRVYSNPDAMAQALKKGEIDFADDLKASVWNGLKDDPDITVYAGRTGGFQEVAFNTGAALDDGTPIGTGHPALKDVRVRRALNHAINRQTLVDRVVEGNGVPASTIIPPLYADLHLAVDPYPFDLAKANALLDEAGYAKGSDGIRRMPGGGRPLSFRLFARQPSQPSQQTTKFVQGWFKEVGVDVQVSVLAEDNLTEKIGQGDFDLFEWGWVVEADPDYQLSTFTCAKRSYREGGSTLANLSDSFYCNPAYDKLYELQATQVDRAARVETVKKMQQMLHDDAPYAMTYYYDDLQAYRSAWTGFVPQPADRGVLLFQFGAWSYPLIHPAEAASTTGAAAASGGGDDAGGVNVALILGGVVGAAAVAAAGVVAARRRRGGGDADVE